MTLRHRDSDLEVALHQLIVGMRPQSGDPYGSGRVTLTGLSRLASQVDPAHLRAIATDEDNLAHLQRLDLGSAVIVPVAADGVTLGALNLVHSERGAVDDDERTPVVRHPASDAESGRGILLVSALSSAWSTDHDVRHGGKHVWAELAL